jgi:hypothetical protein
MRGPSVAIARVFGSGGKGSVVDYREQPPEQAGDPELSPRRFGPDKGEVDRAFGREAHKADGARFVAGDGNDLPFQARRPLLAMPAHRNPRRALSVGIFAGAIADGVEHDVGEGVIVGGGCSVYGVGFGALVCC